jgi:hypothetical protein
MAELVVDNGFVQLIRFAHYGTLVGPNAAYEIVYCGK